MDLMREAKMTSRHFGCVPIPRASVTVPAGVGVVRFLVAFDAVGSRRKVERAFFAGELNAVVTLQTVDALHDVGAVLEGMVLLFLLEAQHLCAGASGAGEDDQSDDCDELSHFFPRQVC
jgi:hypothetical protein